MIKYLGAIAAAILGFAYGVLAQELPGEKPSNAQSRLISKLALDDLLNAESSPLNVGENQLDSRRLFPQLTTLVTVYEEDGEKKRSISQGVYISPEGHILGTAHSAYALRKSKGAMTAFSFTSDGDMQSHSITNSAPLAGVDAAIYFSSLRNPFFATIPIREKAFRDGESVAIFGLKYDPNDTGDKYDQFKIDPSGKFTIKGTRFDFDLTNLVITQGGSKVWQEYVQIGKELQGGDSGRVGLDANGYIVGIVSRNVGKETYLTGAAPIRFLIERLGKESNNPTHYQNRDQKAP